jgi:hypothetical protein
MTSENQMFEHPVHDQHYQPHDSAGNSTVSWSAAMTTGSQ